MPGRWGPGRRVGAWVAGGAGLTLLGLLILFVGPFRTGRPAEATRRLPGVVEVQEVRLGSRVGGRVVEILAAEGELLEPGQPLARLEVPELEARRDFWLARVAGAEAALAKARHGPRPQEIDAARAAEAAAQERWRRLVAGWRPEEIRQAEGDLEAAEADLALAREESERAGRLFARQGIPRAELDAAFAAMERARGRAASARARAEMLRAGSRREDVAEAAAELDRARAQHALLLAGTRPEDVAAAEADLAEMRASLREVEANLRESVVTAPERAVLDVVAVRRGDLLAPNATVARVLRAGDLWVRAYVPEPELGKVRLNQPARVTIDAYPGRRFEGTVVQISSISEFTPRNVQSADERRFQVFGIKVRVADPGGVFKSGLAAEVELPPPGAGR